MEHGTTQTFVELEAEAESMLRNMGMDLEETYRNFLHKIVNKELSEEEIQRIATPRKEKRPFAELFGVFKGKIWMADDFDEPLECMKEYME